MGLFILFMAVACLLPLQWIRTLEGAHDGSIGSRSQLRIFYTTTGLVLASAFVTLYFRSFRNGTAGFVEIPPEVMLYGAPSFWAFACCMYVASRHFKSHANFVASSLAIAAVLASAFLPLLLMILTSLLLSHYNISLEP